MDISGLTYKVRDTVILDSITVQVPDGQVSALIGPNGAGKTTLLRCLSGDLKPGEGQVVADGAEVELDSDRWKATMGVVPDSDALFDELTVSEQLLLAATLFAVPDGRERVDSLLALVGLEEKRDALGNELSAGMRKRLALAMALVHAPRVLLFDEPLNTMDYSSSETFFDLIAYLKSTGRTIIMSGHSLPALLRVADRFIEIDHGKIVNVVDLAGQHRTPDLIAPLLVTYRDAARIDARQSVSLSWMNQ